MKNFAKHAVSLLLALAVILGVSPVWQLTAEAAVIGSTTSEEVPYTAIDTSNFIALPIEIYDYQADGMLFEFASSNNLIKEGTPFYTWQLPQIKYGWDYSKSPGYLSGTKYYADYALHGAGCDLDLNSGYSLEVNRDDTIYYLKAIRSTLNNSKVEDDYVTLGRFGEDVDKSEIRYMVTYFRRYNNQPDQTAGVYLRNTATETPVRVATIAMGTETGWKCVITDLGGSTTSSEKTAWNNISTADYVSISPSSGQSQRLDIVCVAFFGKRTDAEAFASYCDASKRVYYNADKDNHAFGLIGWSRGRNSSNTKYSHTESVSAFNDYNSIELVTFDNTQSGTPTWDKSTLFSATNPATNPDWTYALRGVMSRGQATIGLLQPSLNEHGNPVYQDKTVEHIAFLLESTLNIGKTYNGNLNYRYVSGVANAAKYGLTEDGAASDLADAIRRAIKASDYKDNTAKDNDGGKTGDIAVTNAKGSTLIGDWQIVSRNVKTYTDAAYYLLNNIFVESAYSTKYDGFDTIRLAKTTYQGQECYVFDGGLSYTNGTSATEYDLEKRTIYNTSSDDKSLSYYGTGDKETTTTFPFLPLRDSMNEEGDTDIPYFFDHGASDPNYMFSTYDNRNYNFVLKSQGKFVYDYDDNLFFEFEGDDDVYLFINDELVLDLGGAHPIATQRINLNDYVSNSRAVVDPIIERLRTEGKTEEEIEAYMLKNHRRDYRLAMRDGKAYDFDFFYMERKAFGANLKIMTNMKVSATEVEAQKGAFQSNAELQAESTLDLSTPVEYSFTLKNNGNSTHTDYNGDGINDDNLFNLVFNDNDLGITLTYATGTNGIVKAGSTHKFYKRWCDTSGNDLEPKDLTFIVKDASGTVKQTYNPQNDAELINYLKKPGPGSKGIPAGYTITVRGICVKLKAGDFKNGILDNNVAIYCNANNGQELSDSAMFRHRRVEAMTYYQWVNHPVVLSKNDLKNYLNSVVTFNEDAGYYKIKEITGIELVTANSNVTVANDLTLTYNFKQAGTFQQYFKVTYTDTQNTTGKFMNVPVNFLVYDVDKDVFVLDYGLTVDLGEDKALLDDMTGIAGNTNILEGMSVDTPSYVSGVNKNHIQFNTVNSSDPFEGIFYISYRARTGAEGVGLQVIDASVTGTKYTLNAKLLKSHDEITSAHLFNIQHAMDHDGYSYYTIQSCYNGLYLTSPTTHQTNIEHTAYTGADNQLWRFVDVGTTADPDTTNLPYYSIVSKVIGTTTVTHDGTTKDCSLIIASPPVATGSYNSTAYVQVQQPSNAKNTTHDYITVNATAGNSAQHWTLRRVSGNPTTNFFFEGGSLFYRPSGFMESAEKIHVAVRAYKNGEAPSPIGCTDVTKEVEMFKEVTVLPANVVYYEDDFPAIIYNTQVSGNTIVSDGTGYTQSTQAEDILLDFNDSSIPLQSVYNQALDIQVANGALTYTVGAENHNVYYSGGHNIAGSLNYKPTANMYCQIRFKVDGATVAATNDNKSNDGTISYAGNIRFTLYAIDSEGKGQGYTMNNIPFEHIDGKYYTYTYKLSAAWTNTNPVTGLRFAFNHITVGAKVTIDYVFVGNAADLPAKGWESLMQDNDQDSPYGSDTHYQGSSGSYSGTGYHSIRITNTGLSFDPETKQIVTKPDAYFTFMGTGFELIGRTNAVDSAAIYVRVKDKDGKQVKLIPVITEFDNQNVTGEEIYQVPVVKVEGLDFGRYTAEIIGVAAHNFENGKPVGDPIPTYIYIDGIRIYNPLGNTNPIENYNSGEKEATFVELRELLRTNVAAAVQWNGVVLDVDTNNYGYTENRIGTAYDTVSNYDGHASKINDYILVGPNNELYLSSENNKQAFVLYVKGTGTLQVAMRLVDDDKYHSSVDNGGADVAKLYLGTGTTANPTWTLIESALVSGTEQYYKIDYTKCPEVTFVENGQDVKYRQVVIGVDTGENDRCGAIVSFTNVKYTGLTFKQNTGDYSGKRIRFKDNGVVEVYQVTEAAANTVADPMTASENTQEGTWVELSAEESSKLMRLDLIGKQMAATEVIDPALANRNGVYDVDGTLYYFVNGEIYNSVGLVELNGKYYYVRSGGNVAIGKYWVTNTNGLMPEGYYFFGEDGAMIFNEEPNRAIIEENGILYYYVDGVKQYGAGLIQLDGSYYYIRSAGQAAVGLYWVTNTNGLMTEGFYSFGSDGRMIMSADTAKNGIYEENGALYYYVDGKIQYGAGLIFLDGNYYYIRSSGQAAIGTYWVTTSNNLLPEGFYEFGADGKLINPPTV